MFELMMILLQTRDWCPARFDAAMPTLPLGQIDAGRGFSCRHYPVFRGASWGDGGITGVALFSEGE
jgi:hypothetical protein